MLSKISIIACLCFFQMTFSQDTSVAPNKPTLAPQDKDAHGLITAIDRNDTLLIDKLLANPITRKNLLNKPRIVNGLPHDTPLSIAALRGDQNLVKKLIQAGADKNFIDEQGSTIFMRLVQKNDLPMARLFASLGADINRANNQKQTPLTYAITQNNTEMAQFLLNLDDINVNTQDAEGNTPLMLSAARGMDTIVKRLISAHKINVNNKNNAGQTALMLAAKAGNWDTVLILAEARASLDTQDADGNTLLMVAYYAGKRDIVEKLIKKGANISTVNKAGFNLFSLAAQQGDSDMVQTLIRYGANINQLLPDGSSLLHAFINAGKYDTVALLLQTNTSINVNAQNKQGDTPLMLAILKGHEPTIKLLLERGARKDLRNNNNQTALDLALNNTAIAPLFQLPAPVPAQPQESPVAAPAVEPQPLAESIKRSEGVPAVDIPPTPGADANAAAFAPPPVFEAPTEQPAQPAPAKEKEESA